MIVAFLLSRACGSSDREDESLPSEQSAPGDSDSANPSSETEPGADIGSDPQGGSEEGDEVAGAPPADPPSRRDSRDRIYFVLEPQTDGGTVRCALFDESGWEDREPYDHDMVEVRGDRPVTCEFREIPPGEYALAAFHDIDDSETLDRTALGLPDEPWAISGDPSILFGPPSFESTKFRYDGGVFTLESQLK